ncbi:MAG: SLC13 family permease [Vicinamibacterales bacterium]
MTWEAWVTLGVVALVLYALWRNAAGADVLLLGGALVLCTGSLASSAFPSPRDLARHFGNEGVLTVAALFVVAAGLTETGAISLLTDRVLGVPRTVMAAQLRMMVPVAGLSAVLNNTPVVAIFIPVVNDWCKKTGISPSKLLLPLSYAAVLGGLCTLIGTSTNLVVQAMLVEAHANDPDIPVMTLVTMTPIGVAVCLAGIAYVTIASRWLLPERRSFRADTRDPKQYTVEMLVEPGSPIDGKSIEEAGLRHLPRAFLTAVERAGEPIVVPVAPDHRLRGRDRLLFVGVVEAIADLQRVRGLQPAHDDAKEPTAMKLNRLLVEVVVSPTAVIVGQTIRDAQFRSRYDAAVIAVYRQGARIAGKIGDIVVAAGDALLLQARADFIPRHRHNRDFVLIAPVEESRPVRHHRASAALATLAFMVLLASSEAWTGVTIFHAALLAAGAMGLTGCLSAEQARRSIDVPVLIAIIAALAIGQSMERTGLAGSLAGALVRGCQQFGPWAVLAAVYAVTLFFTEVVTNNAAAALSFPIAHAAASQLDVSLMPFAIAVAVAASAGFATPLGYQTHLMVYGPGGYRFQDFVRLGLPLDLLCFLVTVLLLPLIYGF